MKKFASLVILFGISSVLGGCASRQQAAIVQSGFLTDYDLLEPGGEGQAQLRYEATDIEPGTYTKILFDHVTIWRGIDRDDERVAREDFVRLASYLYDAFLTRLSEDHTVVTEPGPGVARLRLAMTDVDEDTEELVVYSTVLPLPEQPTAAQNFAPVTRDFLDYANVEAELIDSVSEKVLLAGIDREIGDMALDGKADSWDEVRHVFAHWAQQISRGLKRRADRAAGAVSRD